VRPECTLSESGAYAMFPSRTGGSFYFYMYVRDISIGLVWGTWFFLRIFQFLALFHWSMDMLKVLGFSRRWRLLLWYYIAPCHKPGQHNIKFRRKHLVVFRYSIYVGQDTVVGIATRYGLDGPGIQSPWGKVFRTRPDQPCGPPSVLCNRYRVIPEGKRPRCGVDRAPPCSTDVKESRAAPVFPLCAFMADNRMNVYLYCLNIVFYFYNNLPLIAVRQV